MSGSIIPIYPATQFSQYQRLYEKNKISKGAAIAMAVIGTALIVAGIVYDVMEATSQLREIGAGRATVLIEAVMDTIVPSLKEQGGFQAVAGHMLEVEMGVMDIDE